MARMYKSTRCTCTFLLFTAILLVDGCKSKNEDIEYRKPVFSVCENVKFEILSDELVGLNRINDFFLHDDKLFVLAYDGTDKKYLHWYNLSGECLGSSLDYGRGPNDLLIPYSSSYDGESSLLRVYDGSSLFLRSIDLDKTGNPSTVVEAIPLENESSPQKIIYWDKRRLEAFAPSPIDGAITDPRFVLLGKTGDTLSVLDGYPGGISRQKLGWIYNVSSYLELSPDHSKFAAAGAHGEILETFSIEKDRISRISAGYYLAPEFDVVTNQGYFFWDFNDKSVFGFSDLFVDDSYVFLVEDGETNPNVVSETVANSLVVIFDWECHPIKKIQTDYTIRRIFYESGDNNLYAVVCDADSRTLFGRFHLDL